MSTPQDSFNARQTLRTAAGEALIYRLEALAAAGIADLDRLPRTIKVLLEAGLRLCDGFRVTARLHEAIAQTHERGRFNEAARRVFLLPSGEPLPEGAARLLWGACARRGPQRRGPQRPVARPSKASRSCSRAGWRPSTRTPIAAGRSR